MNPPYQISDHESFSCLYRWLPEAARGLATNRLGGLNQTFTILEEDIRARVDELAGCPAGFLSCPKSATQQRKQEVHDPLELIERGAKSRICVEFFC